MKPSSIFWALVRHEYKPKGNWRKINRSANGRWWWIAYFSLLLVVGIGTATYFAIHHTLRLQSLWFVAVGFPYILFFIGHGMLKVEWENDTYGWWLTLPYPRIWLIGSKWLAALLRVLAFMVGLFALGLLYASAIALLLQHYTFADVKAFAIAGLDLLALVVGFGPFLLSLGLLTTAVQYTSFRPIAPFLWVAFMFGGGFLYSLAGTYGVFEMFSGDAPLALMPYPWETFAAIAASWVASYGIVCLVAYLFEHKLDL